MASASQKREQTVHFRLRTDNYVPSHNEGSHQCTVKFGAVAIRGRVDGIQHSNFQDRSFGKSIQSISGRWIKTGLQVKSQNSPCGDSNRRNVWTLTRSGTRKQTDETQNCSEETAHGLGLSFSEKREQHNNFKFA